MKIVIGSDHGGFALKRDLVSFLAEQRHAVTDLGTHGESPVDYPDFAILVAAAVAHREADFGIIVDGAGIGSSIVANKFPGIRAALCNDLFAARNSREHNNANVLTLGARVIGIGLAQEIVKVFLTTEFASRHQPRIDKIVDLERQLFA
ncbi:MAG: ribose 5-phosphate isomerase B [Cyanobacteria bacterium REEB65]|nr:ribose 5-phosphate isomerase B [Cyanobacteria bacterium REEB65]